MEHTVHKLLMMVAEYRDFDGANMDREFGPKVSEVQHGFPGRKAIMVFVLEGGSMYMLQKTMLCGGRTASQTAATSPSVDSNLFF